MLKQTRHLFKASQQLTKPKSSEVLTCYIQQCNEPPWTSYFIKYSSVTDDQWGKSHFNWKVGESNYHILRTGCYPYIKYHCSKRPVQNLILEDFFFRCIKVLNLGWIMPGKNERLVTLICLRYTMFGLWNSGHIFDTAH
ncbi:hypothetical protein AMK59_3501 [Oryctes borbonicus]|uniref:Uncharacterized protein n=1 Tax=Oryctes borbonicus TaxID=1629725 RepID=A0A0T6B5T1_9SCAR|nr:hypothetical protein AMK59_3501 [Oryctes borbonicus]